VAQAHEHSTGAAAAVVSVASPGALEAEAAGHGWLVAFQAADVEDESSVAALVADAASRYGRIDVLVNLVGAFAAGQPVTQLELATWRGMQDVNVLTAFLTSKHVGRVIQQQGAGRILNISARPALSGRTNVAAYAMAKGAIITLTEAQAEELRDTAVTVNCVLPSISDTPTNCAALPNADFARWPKAEEVARVLLFLASDDAQLISGAAIPVYGRA
jgi:NAD(P)-dependent dehydrogenase (short-subunit alcohol dehydrogenase family)